MAGVDSNKFDPIVEPSGDKVHRLARAAIGALPILSGTALEMLNSIIEDPYQKRRTQWLHALTDALNESMEDISRLKDDAHRADLVLSAILQGTDIALKTNDQTIHEHLIRIILNTASSRPAEADLLTIYLSTVRQMTSSHFALLEIIATRARYEKGAELREHETAFFAEVAKCPSISADVPTERLLKDLESMQLIFSPAGSPASLGGSTNYCTKTLSQFGTKFLEYVGTVGVGSG
jgi:hypothetical protein